MKRIIIFLLLFCSLFLSACSGEKCITAKDIDFVFSCKIDVVSQNEKYICSFRRTGCRNASAEVLSGNGKGLKWLWNGNGFSQNYLGLLAENETCVLPQKSFASTLVDALDCAEKPEALKSAGNNVFSGSIDGGTFTITVDGNTGEIRSLCMPDRDLAVTFHDFSETAFSGD